MRYIILIILILAILTGCSNPIEDGDEILAQNNSIYMEFNEKSYDEALADGKIVVLFFYANWCPSCKEENLQAIEAFKEINRSDIVAFRVNYKDFETSEFENGLAKENGVTYQHVKVILQNGERIEKAVDVWNKTRYIDEISKL